MNKDQLTGNQKRKIPEPPHPRERREPLPWHLPKATEEDPEAHDRVRTILNSPSYRLAEEDVDFLARDDLRGVRLLVDYLKPELLLEEHGIRHAIVVFGSTRICEPNAARRKVETLQEGLAADAGNENLERQLAIAERILAKSHYYDMEGPQEGKLPIIEPGQLLQHPPEARAPLRQTEQLADEQHRATAIEVARVARQRLRGRPA